MSNVMGPLRRSIQCVATISSPTDDWTCNWNQFHIHHGGVICISMCFFIYISNVFFFVCLDNLRSTDLCDQFELLFFSSSSFFGLRVSRDAMEFRELKTALWIHNLLIERNQMNWVDRMVKRFQRIIQFSWRTCCAVPVAVKLWNNFLFLPYFSHITLREIYACMAVASLFLLSREYLFNWALLSTTVHCLHILFSLRSLISWYLWK